MVKMLKTILFLKFSHPCIINSQIKSLLSNFPKKVCHHKAWFIQWKWGELWPKQRSHFQWASGTRVWGQERVRLQHQHNFILCQTAAMHKTSKSKEIIEQFLNQRPLTPWPLSQHCKYVVNYNCKVDKDS